MVAVLALLAVAAERSLAFVAKSPDTLAGLLVYQILATGFAWSGENDIAIVPEIIRDERRVLLIGLLDGSLPFAASEGFGFAAFRRIPSTFCAASVRAVGAFFGRAEDGAAQVACSPDAHANGLVYAENGVVDGYGLPVGKINV